MVLVAFCVSRRKLHILLGPEYRHSAFYGVLGLLSETDLTSEQRELGMLTKLCASSDLITLL